MAIPSGTGDSKTKSTLYLYPQVKTKNRILQDEVYIYPQVKTGDFKTRSRYGYTVGENRRFQDEASTRFQEEVYMKSTYGHILLSESRFQDKASKEISR